MKYLILGGTGTLGHALTREILNQGSYRNEVVILSRSEKNQAEMKRKFPQVKFIIGDIRDKASIVAALDGVHTCILAAAMKHVNICEQNVAECIATNVGGVKNTIEACGYKNTAQLVFISSDKAVHPINCYGMSKYQGEKLIQSWLRGNQRANASIFRWGNIIGSNGSVIPYFIEALRAGTPINITDIRMTRFWLNVREAVTRMLSQVGKVKSGEAVVIKSKAAPVVDVVAALADILDVKDYRIKEVGLRGGEKLHEALEWADVDSGELTPHVASNNPEYMFESKVALKQYLKAAMEEQCLL